MPDHVVLLMRQAQEGAGPIVTAALRAALVDWIEEVKEEGVEVRRRVDRAWARVCREALVRAGVEDAAEIGKQIREERRDFWQGVSGESGRCGTDVPKVRTY